MASVRLTYTAHGRAALVLGLPLIGSHLAQYAVQVVDTVMLGWYDVTSLAAVVLGSSFFFVFFLMGSGFAWAVMPVVASAAASGEHAQVRRVTRMAIWLSLIFAVAVLPLMIFSAPILRALGQEPAVVDEAAAYLRIAGWGMIPALLVMVLKSYLAGLERTQVVLWSTVAAAILNGLLNYALIFGNWGAPELGIRGAAIASVALQLASLGILVVYAARVTAEHEIFVRFWRPDWEAFGRVFRLGWPIGLTSLAEVGLFAGSAILIGLIGVNELAAHGIALQVASATFLVHLGLSNAATIRAGQAHGHGDEDELRRGAAAVSLVSVVFAIVTAIVFIVTPEPLIAVFLDPGDPARPEVIAIGAGLLLYGAFFQLADSGQVIALGLLRGVQDTRVPMVYAALSYWAIGMPAAYLCGFTFGLGAPGVWIGLGIGLSFAWVSMAARFWLRSSRIGAARLSPAPS